MTVIGVGDLQMVNGERFSGLVIQATREELQAVAGNVLYKEVEVTPHTEGTTEDVFREVFGDMADALCAIDKRVREAKPSRKYSRDEVLAMLDEIDPEDRTKGGATCR